MVKNTDLYVFLRFTEQIVSFEANGSIYQSFIYIQLDPFALKLTKLRKLYYVDMYGKQDSAPCKTPESLCVTGVQNTMQAVDQSNPRQCKVSLMNCPHRAVVIRTLTRTT